MGLPVFVFKYVERGKKMIYTLTINPSLDYIMEMDEISVGKMNRSKTEYILPGGKGINVSQILNELGVENVAILPVAGFTGKKLLDMLANKGIETKAIQLKEGDTRINVKVLGDKETELNAGGPKMEESEKKELLAKLEELKEGDYLVLSGSVPSNLGNSFYAEIMELLNKKQVKVVVDTIGENLKNALQWNPFLIKPNVEELEDLFEEKIDSREKVLSLAVKLRIMGAENVLVSLGKEGALLLTSEDKCYEMEAPNSVVINSVGAGDSMVAGFLAGFMKTNDMETALKLGIAAGSASAFSKKMATRQEIDALFHIL